MNAIGIVAFIFFVVGWAGALISSFYMAYQIALVWLGRGTQFGGLKGFAAVIAC